MMARLTPPVAMSETSEQPSPADPAPPPFLDVPTLLAASRPRPRVNWGGYVLLGMVGLVFSSVVTIGRGHGANTASVSAMVTVLVLGLILASFVSFTVAVGKHRRQVQAIESIEEMVQLRRWEPAGMLLNGVLTDPVRSPRVWVRGLVQLSAVLGRHHRFADAVEVDDFLLDHDGLLDESGAYAVRCMRAMALLRDDRLLDADRAISDLRRRGPKASGPLALIEIYRDVKTGHPAEAIDLFGQRRDVLQQHLGHRSADAHALVARAYDLLDRPAEAAAAYRRATALAPAAELHRRYPELAPLADKYPATPAPREVA